MKVIETDRLILRTWTDKDTAPYYEINQNPKVIEFLLGPMTEDEVQNFMREQNNNFDIKRFCLLAVEIKNTEKIIGFIGLSEPKFEAYFTPCVEIGWRLGSQYWGKGYATEGAQAILKYGFKKCNLNEIVSFTAANNIKSIQVMGRIGMQKDSYFNHPKLDNNHQLSKHILYKIQKS
jgi:RimJ/RimL family protein N-acetyltransferase